MQATRHPTVSAMLSTLTARQQWGTKDMIATTELSGLVLADMAAQKLAEAAAGPALFDFRRAALAVAAKDIGRLRAAAGERAAVALLGTAAQLDTLREAAWWMAQAGCMAAAFDDEAQARQWIDRWDVQAVLALA